MRARVFVTLKPSVFDPQGRTIADALHSLGYGDGRRRAAGQVLRARPATRAGGGGAGARGGGGRQAARQPGHRELPRRGRRHEVRRRRLPRQQLRPRRVPRGDSTCSASMRDFVWHKDTEPEGRRCRHPAGRLLVRRLPALRRDGALLAGHARRSRAFAARGGPVLGICNGFQILLEAGLLPGAMLRNRESQVPLRARARARRADRHAVHRAPAAAARCCACRSPTARATTSPIPRRSRGSKPTVRSSSATATRRASVTDAANPNGSVANIAGICNERAQRRRPDAASRARLRAGARQRRRPASSSNRSCKRSRPARPLQQTA